MVDIGFLLEAVLRNASAIVLAVLGESIAERGGVLNLGLDGVMLVGGLAGVAIAVMTGSFEAGVLLGGLAGLLFTLLYALLVNALKLNQIVSGIAIYMLSVALTTMLGKPYAGQPLPSPITIGGIEVVVIAAYLLPIAIYAVLRITRFDVKLRMVGDDPLAADMAGLDVSLVRTIALMLNGLLAGMAGAIYVMLVAGRWRALATGGAGWLALALTPMTLWEPLLSYLPGLVYSATLLSKSLAFQWLPDEAREALPYITVFVVATIVVKVVKSRMPRSLGRVYIHGTA